MFITEHEFSTVTAVLPTAAASRVFDGVICEQGTSALVRKARGTLLHDRWWKSWVPPISPSRSMLQMLVPNSRIEQVVETVVELGNLHLQASGAVFSTRCDRVYLGSDYLAWPGSDETKPHIGTHELDDGLSIIYCVVGHQIGERVAKAAIRAGSHGPIVYYVEGRGLRDRLGWLRITKDTEQEVLMVMADAADVEDIFDAMAKAGELHLPGRGFMYRLKIDKGMFNLASRGANHHYDANMQQIINAIDHLSGHTHWRDKSVVDIAGDVQVSGLDFLKSSSPLLFNQVCLSATINRSNHHTLMDLMLDAGAPGLNMTFAQNKTPFVASDSELANISEEYAMFRCITDETVAENICVAVEESAEAAGLTDLSFTTQSVPRVARYIPSNKEHRGTTSRLAVAS